MSKENKIYIKFLISLFLQYNKLLLLLLILLITAAGIKIIIPITSKFIIDDGFMIKSYKNILFYVFAYFALVLISSLISFFKEIIRVKINFQIKRNLYEFAFEKLKNVIYSFIKENDTMELYNKVDTDIRKILTITDQSLIFSITEIFAVIGGIIGLCLINYKMTLITLTFIPVKFFIIMFFTQIRERYINSYIESSSRYAKWFGDFMDGLKEIRIFGLFNYEKNEFNKKIDDVIKVEKKFTIIDNINENADAILSELLTAIIYIVSANYVLEDQISIGSIFAFITYTSNVINPISSILNIRYLFADILPSTKRFCSLLEEKEEVKGNEVLYNIHVKEIKLKNICFKYSEEHILKDLDINIKQGEKIAIVGKNGTGKSTLINILLRIYNISNGQFQLNDKGVYDIDIESYRNLITVVNQDIHIFDMSIKDNIVLFKQYDKEKFNEIIELCGLRSLIEAEGKNVGSNGAKLSGGERQRIALARALLHDKQIILLDEATSNLDYSLKLAINNLITGSFFYNKIIIFVTHRNNLLEKTDKVILLDYNGKNIVDTHANLLNTNDMYKEFIKS